MSSGPQTKDTGLRGIPVADTAICMVDGLEGRLLYRGYNIGDLAFRSTYEEVSHLLLYESLPTKEQLDGYGRKLSSEREAPDEIVDILKILPKGTSIMDALQCSVPMISSFDVDAEKESVEVNLEKSVRLISKTPTLVAAWTRLQNDLPPVTPRNDLSHAANFLYMLTNTVPDENYAKLLDLCLILHAEHAFNASTFAARVVSSTGAHMYASVTAALGALSGPLHGGANVEVMRSLEEIGEPSNVEAWVKSRLDRKMKIMGMGHAVYKNMDPRAAILREMGEKIPEVRNDKRYQMVKSIEDTTRRELKARRGFEIYPNVDLYSGPIYYALGIPPDIYTAVFAIARMSGWTAHVIEEKYPKPPVRPTLYRPESDYIGNYCGRVGCAYQPIEDRKALEP